MKLPALLLVFLAPLAVFAQCPDCCNGVMDCSETGIDCGGPDCMPCASLVPNGSFECTADCFVFGAGQIQSATPWTYVDASEPADLYNSCFVFDTNILTPTNFRGTQAPHTGAAYAGFRAQNDPTSDPRAGYVQVPLSSPLVAGNFYDLSFWVSLCDNYGTSMGGLGAYFSVGAVAPGDNAPLSLHSIFPQIESDNFVHFTDGTIWHQVTGTYTAGGGETHLVIGNFKTTYSPPSPLVTYTCCNSVLSYYYIDDVSLVFSGGLPVNFSAFNVEVEGDMVQLDWTTETEQNSSHFFIQRGSDTTNFEDIGEVVAAGNSISTINYKWFDQNPLNGPNYYRIKEVDLDGATQYTHIRSVDFSSSVFYDQISFNPDQTVLNYELTLTRSNERVQIQIFDQHGKLQEQVETFIDGKKSTGSVAVAHLKSGLYFVRFSTERHAVSRKFAVVR